MSMHIAIEGEKATVTAVVNNNVIEVHYNNKKLCDTSLSDFDNDIRLFLDWMDMIANDVDEDDEYADYREGKNDEDFTSDNWGFYSYIG